MLIFTKGTLMLQVRTFRELVQDFQDVPFINEWMKCKTFHDAFLLSIIVVVILSHSQLHLKQQMQSDLNILILKIMTIFPFFLGYFFIVTIHRPESTVLIYKLNRKGRRSP